MEELRHVVGDPNATVARCTLDAMERPGAGMNAELLIYIGGGYQLLWALAHFHLPKQLDWENALAKLDDFNRILMLIFSKLLLFFYVGTAVICFAYPRELLDTDLGSALLIFLSAYWLVRALLQVRYFGFKRANTLNVQMSPGGASNETVSYILFVMFLLGTGLYLAPVVLARF